VGGAKQKSSPESRIDKDDIMLRLKLSDRDVYKGEAIRASLVLYTRVSISDVSDVNIPSFDGFWSQELTFDNTPSREEYNGRIYETHKITELLLSPQKSGKITIPAASMTVRTPVEVQGNRHFDPFFGGRQIHYVTKQLKSEPIVVDVREFPQGAPRSFNGAVGDFRISYRMPSSEIESNSADQLELTISGSGNLKFIAAPRLNLPDSFELYDTKIVDNIKVAASGTTGSITYTYPFVARSAGEFTIAPIEFSYFDPQRGEYKTLSTEPYTITIKDDGSAPAQHSVGNYINYGATMRQLDKDIRFIHIRALPPKSASIFIFTPIYWLVVVVLLAIFVVVYVVMRKRIRDNRNIVARRMKRADKVAIQRLRMAERSMNEGNRHAFYEETLRAMWGYISDKFNIPVSNLTKEKIREELYRRGVAMAVAEEFCEIISRSEEAQYAPTTDGEMSVVYADAIDVMTRIEDVVKQ
ncbi:MAG: protein BatD, partial [Alistipes sp.]|nr:protein BatD [Alistipes sp.]